MIQRIRPALACAAAVMTLVTAPAFAGKTLDAVKQRGTVKCGVTNGVAGFSAPDTQGNWSEYRIAHFTGPERFEAVRLRRSIRSSASRRCRPARSTSWRATLPGR